MNRWLVLGCLRKRAYPDRAAAAADWEGMRRRGVRGTQVYRCVTCQAFHIGRRRKSSR